MQTGPIGNEELDRRIIPPSDFVADASAFIDVRLPDSQGKLNFAFIGPGVSQNPDQHVNVREPHGFSIGAAGLPPGTVNNQHLHFTAEVFMKFTKWNAAPITKQDREDFAEYFTLLSSSFHSPSSKRKPHV